MSEWIPTNERLPGPSENAIVYATTTDGFVGRWEARRIRDNPEIYLAWMPAGLPGPYVPPKPKRKRVWLDRRCDRWREQIPGRSYHNSHPQAVEVLPGDPDPDKAIEARGVMVSMIEAVKEGNLPQGCFDTGDLKRLAKILGEQFSEEE